MLHTKTNFWGAAYFQSGRESDPYSFWKECYLLSRNYCYNENN